jgi:hypothetical protein
MIPTMDKSGSFFNFRGVIAHYQPNDFREGAPSKPDLLIPQASDQKTRTYYAPFDHVNAEARIALVGITPGREQMNNALRAACSAIHAGNSDSEALVSAKQAASFSGSMRETLIKLLDRYDFQHRLGIKTTRSVWSDDNHLVHFTSSLRNPVFRLEGGIEKNYTGGNPTLSTYQGFKDALRQLSDELLSLQHALIIPLGDKVAQVIQSLVSAGTLPLTRVLNAEGRVAEFPHPSGANGESHALAFLDELPSIDDYAYSKLQKYREEQAKESKIVSREQERRYLSVRHSYWERARHTRAALK